MVNFLKKILSVLPDAQKAAVKNLIAERAKNEEFTSIRIRQNVANQIYNRIRGKLGGLLLSPIYANPDDKISSEDYNSVMEEIYLDLNSLYVNINDLSKTIKKQSVTLDSEYNKSRAAIEKLLNDVKVFILRKQNPDFNEIKLIDFNVASNLSKKQPVADIDPQLRLLKLKPVLNSRVHLPNRAARTTAIYTKTYSHGLKGDLSSVFPPENMVDQRPETFWATLVLADAPVSQIYQLPSTSNDVSQVVVDGPIVEVYFRFSHVEKINTVKVAPFSEFPVDIISIAYRETTSTQLFTPIDDFSQSTTLDWEEYNFSPIMASEVRITIAQTNYRKLPYLLPKSLVINTDLFHRILNFRASKLLGHSVFDSDFSLYLLNNISSYDDALKSLEELLHENGVDTTTQPNIEYLQKVDEIIREVYTDIAPDELSSFLKLLTSEESQQRTIETINIEKYEYLLGIREVEIGYQIYYPVSNYESEKLLPQATVSEIQMEVDERHPSFKTPWEDNFRKTSTEWEVDIGGGRRIPIHPRNIREEGLPSVKDERIEFDLLTNKAYTRLGSYYSTPYRLKKNGEVLSPEAYQVIRTTGSIPRLELTLTGQNFDPLGIYTVDYPVDPSSYSIDILTTFDSEPIPSPELFQNTESDNNITLSKYPYINYEVINSTGIFFKETTSTWNFVPPIANATSGQIFIYPTIKDNVGNVLQQGHITGLMITGLWGSQSGITPVSLTSLDAGYFGTIKGIEHGYFFKPMDSAIYSEIASFPNFETVLFKEPPVVTQNQCQIWDSYQTGLVFSGLLTGNTSGHLRIDYTIGVGVKTDNQIFAISDITYSPIEIRVGNKLAKNITDYETLVHPAFSVGQNLDTEYQYIQAGQTVYFNQKITNKEISVTYRWLTEYIKVLGTLYCNTAINPDLTPKVNQIRIYSNNLII